MPPALSLVTSPARPATRGRDSGSTAALVGSGAFQKLVAANSLPALCWGGGDPPPVGPDPGRVTGRAATTATEVALRKAKPRRRWVRPVFRRNTPTPARWIRW